MKINKASPKLLLACATGDHIKEAVLVCRKAGAGFLVSDGRQCWGCGVGEKGTVKIASCVNIFQLSA